jgi:hypothetical protein
MRSHSQGLKFCKLDLRDANLVHGYKVGGLMERNTELIETIQQFYQLLDRIPDRPSSTYDFAYFIKQFLRTKVDEGQLPTIEVMTVFKYSKPKAYYSMRQFAKKDPILHFLMGLDMNLKSADERLKQLLKQNIKC